MSSIPQNVQAALNDQIRNELHSAYLYLAMSAHFEAQSLSGLASWMRIQAREEVTHGMKLFDYLAERGGKIQLQGIEAPPPAFDAALSVFKQAYAHEQKITAAIHALYGLAAEEKDYATQLALEWFVTEQVEEEKTASDIVAKLELVGENKVALLRLDHELGKRGAK